MTKREQMLGGLVVAALVGVAAWSYSALQDSRARAEAQAQRTAQATALVKKIEGLRKAGTAAGTGGVTVEVSRRIPVAAEIAGCSEAIERIEPEGPRSLGDSGKLREVPTRVSLGKITLAQGLHFIRALEAADPAVRATSVRWIAGQGETWNGEIVFSRVEAVAGER